MAKKGVALQLQTEVHSDEDWDHLLQKEGLIVVDVYSEWCGPCVGMVATLKKIKLEIGGDILHLATAKAEGVTALNRFIGNSEPTWMLVAKGKMVSFMFGANAPKLTQMIINEFKKETEAMEGKRERVLYEIEEPTPLEQQRIAVIEAEKLAEEELERKKIEQEIFERRSKECNSILENLSQLGVILVLPNATKRYQEVINTEALNEAGLSITKTEKVQIKDGILEELFYFADNKLSDSAIEEILKLPSLALLLKRSSEHLPSIDDVICQMVYGNSRKPPGDDDKTPYQQLLIMKQNCEMPGLWTPLNSLTKAMCLKLFFPNTSSPYLLPIVQQMPLHIAIAYDTFKYRNIMELSSQYPGQVMKYGFFTSDIPGEAKLISKTIDKFENRTEPPTYEEKIVVQLAKTLPECVEAFYQLGPSYRSKNAVVGEDECKLIFGSIYDEPDDQNNGEIKKRKRKSKSKTTIQSDNQSETNENHENIAEYICEIENEMGDLEEAVVESELIVEGDGEDDEGIDKATSPMCFATTDINEEAN